MVIELSGVQFGQKSYVWFQNRFDLKSQVWFQTKIARPEVQLPLYYIHFEIAQFNSLNTRTTRTTKVAKFAKQWPFCLSFSCNVIGKFKKPSNLIACFVLLSRSHWLRKRCDLEQKIVWFGNKSHCWKPIRLQG